MQLFVMEVLEDSSEGREEDVPDETKSPVGNQEDAHMLLVISLNAMHGDSSVDALRVVGQVGRCTMHILIDTGSTHNILDISVAREVKIKTQNISPAVAGGSSLWVYE